MASPTCLILLLKAPSRSKRRLRAELGASVDILAECLCDCALEDLAAWDGPRCLAAASADDRQWLISQRRQASEQVTQLLEQGPGNLGTRIEHVSHELAQLGYPRQIFIGTDCPGMDKPYIEQAAAKLRTHDVVLGPARDGGVVLMGTRSGWPPMTALAWSTALLGEQLRAACHATDRQVGWLEERADVDTAADLAALHGTLAGSERTSRLALGRWLADNQGMLDQVLAPAR